MLTPIYLDMGDILSQVGQNIKIFNFLCTTYMANSELMTSSTHSFAYSYRLVKKCFVKICETSKCHNFLSFQPIFMRFSLLCLKFFTLSSEIKLNLFRTSPLISWFLEDYYVYLSSFFFPDGLWQQSPYSPSEVLPGGVPQYDRNGWNQDYHNSGKGGMLLFCVPGPNRSCSIFNLSDVIIS